MNEHRTNSDIRKSNTKSLVNILFQRGQMTKQELAQELGISQPTVATIIKELKEKGLVKDGEAMDSTGGRKPLCHLPVYDAKYSIGVESSREKVRIVVVDLGANVVGYETYDLKRNYSPDYWRQINSFILDFIEKKNVDRSKLLDIGITVDETMKDEIVVPSKEGAVPLNIEEAKAEFDFNVVIRSSSKMAAIAQHWLNKQSDSYLYINLGTNVRGAMVYEGLVLDFAEINCEFGNMLIHAGSLIGHRLSDVISGEALFAKAKVHHAAEFMAKLDAGDEECERLWSEYISVVAIFIYNMHIIYGWDIIIGGRMSSLISRDKARIDEEIAKLCKFKEDVESVFIVSKHAEYSAVIGAAMLPIDRFF